MINLIFASGENGEFGTANGLPWERNKADMEHFKESTSGGAVLMGYKTFETLGSKPLKDRLNIVLTNDFPDQMEAGYDLSRLDEGLVFIKQYKGIDTLPIYYQEGLTTIIKDVEKMISPKYKDLWVIGGVELLRAALPIADQVLHTEIHKLTGEEVTKKLYKLGFFEYLYEPSLFTLIGSLKSDDGSCTLKRYVPTVKGRF